MLREAYDDAVAVRAYSIRHHVRFLTPLEHRVFCSTVPVVLDSPYAKVRKHHEALEQTDGHVEDADVIAIYDADPEGIAFREQAIQRLIREHSHRINRCPACQRVARTPTALLCPWCKHTLRNVNIVDHGV